MAFYLVLSSVHRPLKWRTHLTGGSLLRAQSLSQDLPGPWHFRFSIDSDNSGGLSHLCTLPLTLWLPPYLLSHTLTLSIMPGMFLWQSGKNVPWLFSKPSSHRALFLRGTLTSQYFPPIFQEMFVPLGNFCCVFCRRIAEDQRGILGPLIRDLICSHPSPNICIMIYFNLE